MAAEEKGREPQAASLLASVAFHALAALGIVASSWWWGASTLDTWKTHTVSLVDAPLSLRQPSPPPAALPTKASSLPKPPRSESVKPPSPLAKAALSAPKPKAKLPSRAKPVPKPKAKSPSRAKPAPVKPASAPQVASSKEARSAVEALRQRQAKRKQEQEQAEATRQQAASARVDALRDQLVQEETIGSTAVRAAGVQRVRLMAYQDRVRAKIVETWILPLSAEQTHDLQATAQFQVTRNGNVVQLELVKASGNTLFDVSLLRAIRRASPLPTLPADYPAEILEVEMRFRAQ